MYKYQVNVSYIIHNQIIPSASQQGAVFVLFWLSWDMLLHPVFIQTLRFLCLPGCQFIKWYEDQIDLNLLVMITILLLLHLI